MAQPTTLRWTKLSIWPGNGGTPELFTSAVCGLTTKTFALAGATTDQVVPDCDTPDNPAWIQRIVRSLSSQVGGSGLMANENWATWRDWCLGGLAKNVRIVVELPSSPGYFYGSYLLTSFELSGTLNNGKIETTIQLQSDGQVSWAVGTP